MPSTARRAQYAREPMAAPEDTMHLVRDEPVATEEHLANVRRAILHLRYTEDLLIGASTVLGSAWAWAKTGEVRKLLSAYDPMAPENR